MTLRLLFVVNLIGVGALFVLLDPLIALFGPQYVSLRVPLSMAVLFGGVAAPGMSAGTLLSSAGKQQEVAYVYLGQLMVLVGLFISFWARWELLGAVLATGIASLLSSVSLLIVAKRITPVRFTVGRDYFKFVIISGITAMMISYPRALPIGPRSLIYLSAVALFLASAGYSVKECKALISCFLPTRVADQWANFASSGKDGLGA